jgi:hypothetical protein
MMGLGDVFVFPGIFLNQREAGTGTGAVVRWGDVTS